MKRASENVGMGHGHSPSVHAADAYIGDGSTYPNIDVTFLLVIASYDVTAEMRMSLNLNRAMFGRKHRDRSSPTP